MNQKLPMIVTFKIAEENIDFMLKEFKKILEPTRQEQGCLLYELHQDLNDPCIFMFYEVWETTEAWKKHDTMPYIVSFKKIIEETNTVITFNKLQII